MRVAVVGVGGWGKNHVRVMKQLAMEGLVDVVYAVDINEERLRFVERVYGVIPLKSIDEVLGKDVDAAVVATPTRMHYQHAKALISSGISVLVEKPFTTDLVEAEELLGMARGRTVVTIGLLLRFHGGVRFVKGSLNRVGRVLAIYAKRTSFWPRRQGDVGVIRDLAIHDVDLVTFITGSRAKEVVAKGGSVNHEYEDHVQILASYDGFSTVIEANWVTPYKVRRLEVTGERGIFTIDFTTDTVALYTEEGAWVPRLTIEEPLLVQDREFLRAVGGLGGEVVPREDILYVVKFCEAARRSMETGEVIKLA